MSTRRDIEWLDYRRKDGSIAFNREHATEHFLVVGASGSGKTTIINNLMASVVRKGANTKALVYDPKQEVAPLLYELHNAPEVTRFVGGAESVKILNPFDQRCFAWDMAVDIDNVVSARQVATILVPEKAGAGGSESFFTNATRDILTALMVSFIETMPKEEAWTFRDLILAALYEPYLMAILKRSDKARSGKPIPMLGRVWDTYFGGAADARTRANIRASLSANLAIFEPIAAAWHNATAERRDTALGIESGADRFFSLKEWALTEGEEILVLGNDETSRAALDAINQAIFKRATELVLARPERSDVQKASGVNQVWFFLDEVREAGFLDGLSRLLTKGRSKGACIVMGFQDIDGLRDVYGEDVANEICAQCNNAAIMRINSPSTALWASDSFGRRLTGADNRGVSLQTGGDSKGVNVSRGVSEEERPYLYTDAFLYLPTAREAKGVVGFSKGPGIDLTGLTNSQAQEKLRFRVEKETRTTRRPSLFREAFMPVPSANFLLEPWTEEDFSRLGLDGPPPPWFWQEKTPPASSGSGKRPSLQRWLPESNTALGVEREE